MLWGKRLELGDELGALFFEVRDLVQELVELGLPTSGVGFG